MKRHYRLLRDRFLTLLRQSPYADRMTVQGDEAGLHFLLQLQTPLPDAAIEEKLAAAGIRAASLSQYQTAPAEQQGRVVIHYSDLEETDLPGVITVLEQLVTT